MKAYLEKELAAIEPDRRAGVEGRKMGAVHRQL